MKALSQAFAKYLPVQGGHFRQCPDRNEPPLAHNHGQGCYRCKAKAYAYAIVLNALVAGLEFWGSHQTASLALESDAWHMAFDSLGYCIGLFEAVAITWFVLSEKRVETNKRNLERLMAVFLIGTGIFIAYEVGLRMLSGDVPHIVESGLLLNIAVLGLLTNLLFFVLLWALGIQHTHGDGHHHADPHTHRDTDNILSGNLWHTLSDIVSSVLVVGNGITYQFASGSSWFILEFPVSFCIASLLVWQGWRIFFPKNDANH